MLRRTIYDGCDGYVMGVGPFIVEFNRYTIWLRLGPLLLIVSRGAEETREEIEQRSEALTASLRAQGFRPDA